jgi:RNA polymerase subunit RPABC4/transcription elongation factor Spt4
MTTSAAVKYDPEPTWKVLTLPALKTSAKEVLGRTPKKRTIKGAYEELYVYLTKESGRDLSFTCQNCGSLIDDEMEKCWACGLVFSEDSEEEVVDTELSARARRLGIDPEGKERDELLEAIEAAETKARKAKENVDLLAIESQKLNEALIEAMPDGWRPSRVKQFTAYFDPQGVKRIGVYHRGLKIDFLVDEKFFDGFPDVSYFSPEERKKRHFGRVNYQYNGDMANQAIELVKRVFSKY